MNVKAYNPTREEVLSLPAIERVDYVQWIEIRYRRWNDIYHRFERCYRLSKSSSEPRCFGLVGHSGAGKSTIAKRFAAEHPYSLTETSVNKPVIYMSIPAPATVKSVASGLLASLGDPRAFNGTLSSMNYRLVNFIRDCEVKLIILDELQHLIDRDTERILQTVSDWLKHLIKETKVGCVLVGLQDEAEKVIQHNPQILRLFGDPVTLHPFQWDERKTDSALEYRRFLRQIETLLPLRDESYLSQRERAWRCYVASEGLVGYTMSLIRTATEFALEEGDERLNDELLSRAFDHALGGVSRDIDNPFLGDAPSYRTPEERRRHLSQSTQHKRRIAK